MNLQKLNWKFFIENPALDLPQHCFRVFNTWIPASPEVFIDVVDYSHVVGGPLTLLCGFHADVVLDATAGRTGLLYAHKRPLRGDDLARLRTTLSAALHAALRLAEDTSIPGGVDFSGKSFLLWINDRAIAPNTKATFDVLRPLLVSALDPVLGTRQYELKHEGSPRERFAVEIVLKTPGMLREWAHNLS